ncbi:MAG TPA: polysaccharide biosynthesis tyrosine autokinase [Tepidisphaeraceae bacterium]|jgi:capsular exopolysaccharide synthesis family protein|nr:polysaccharide biosynthesis tyrosine autokinase [Tepidisphaeraceae bacterium]
MTTLPQTTSVRLQRTGSPQIQIPGGPGGLTTPTASMSGADAWRVIRQNMWLIALFVVLSAALGYGAFLLLQKYSPRYTSMGLIRVQPAAKFNPLDQATSTMDMQSLQIEQRTQASLLKGDSLFSQVLEKSDEIKNTDWFRQIGNVEDAKRDLARNLSVSPIPDTRLISVSFSFSKPEDARKIVYEVVNQHLINQQELNRDMQLRHSVMLNSMKSQYQAKLSDIAQDLREKSIRLNIDGMGVPGRLSAKEVELGELVRRQLEVASAASQAKSMYESAAAQVQKGDVPSKVEDYVQHDPTVLNTKQQIDQVELTIQSFGTELGPENQRLKQLQSQKQYLTQRLEDAKSEAKMLASSTYMDALKDQATQAQEAQDSLEKRVTAVKSDLGELNATMNVYLNRKDEERNILEEMKKIDAELTGLQQINQAQDLSAVAWMSQPDIPGKMSFPDVKMTMGIAIFLGLCASLGIAFLREMMDTSVRSPRDIAKVGQMNLLGMIPDVDDDPQAVGGRLPLVISDSPTSMTAEQFRQVRTRLQHAASLDTTRSILVTSPSAGDGKTTVAVNLAAGLALNGRRILLVDSNFKRPELHKIFGVGNDRGLSSVLASLDNFEESAKQTKVPNLSVMGTGPKPANPTELMESQLLIDFIDRALKDYDHVIFDSGPILLSSETTAMAPRVDGVVSVVRARANSRGILQRMRDTLRQLKAEHLGVVLNGVRSQGGGYYGRNIKAYYEYQNGNS